MQRATTPEQTNLNRLLFPVLVVYSVGIPLHLYITNVAAMALGLLGLWRLWKQPFGIKDLFNPWTILNLVFYGFHALAILSHTFNTSEALFDLEVKLSILVLPIFLGLFKNEIVGYSSVLLRYFAWSSSVVIASILVYGLYLFYSDVPYESILYTGMTAPLGVHHAYLSLYGLASIMIFLYIESKSKLERSAKFVFSLVILLFIYFSLSKIHILAAMLVIPLGIYSQLKAAKQSKASWFYALFTVLALFCFGYFYSPVKVKMAEAFEALTGKSEKTYENANNRIIKWESAFEVFLQSPIIGVGPGDVQKHLNTIYEEKKFSEGIHHQYNAHNQFLQTLAGLGIIGLISLLALIFYLYHRFQKVNEQLPFLILTIYAFTMLTESLLCVNAGIVFHAFILSILVYHKSGKHN